MKTLFEKPPNQIFLCSCRESRRLRRRKLHTGAHSYSTLVNSWNRQAIFFWSLSFQAQRAKIFPSLSRFQVFGYLCMIVYHATFLCWPYHPTRGKDNRKMCVFCCSWPGWGEKWHSKMSWYRLNWNSQNVIETLWMVNIGVEVRLLFIFFLERFFFGRKVCRKGNHEKYVMRFECIL